MEGIYRQLTAEELQPVLFEGFERRQEVDECWRREDGRWVLKHCPFVDDWGPAEYERLCGHLQNTVRTGGMVLGAFEDGKLAGFGSLEGALFGSAGQYVQLSCLHVTRGLRGRGIGARLFGRLAAGAREMGAQKLYISGHSAKETQAFYARMGCAEAQEYCGQLVEKEPYDCQLEYPL